ncbi:hypothetical protein SLE2022_324390 [Rubroshorea leprosula]
MGVVCRDSKWSLLAGHAFKQAVSSVLMAEALALRAAVGMAVSQNVTRAIFELDNKLLIQIVNKERQSSMADRPFD